jgi:CheY-like chemotaxis protein
MEERMRSLTELTLELDRARERAFADAEQNDGVVADYMAEVLDNLELAREIKIESVALAFKDASAFVAELQAEKKRIDERLRVFKNDAERIKKYLGDWLADGEKMETPKVKIGWRKSNATVVDDAVDVTTLPEQCQNVKITANKTEIGKLLKSGVEIDGCRIEQRVALQIK